MRNAIIHRPALLLAGGLILGVVAPEQILLTFLVVAALLAFIRAPKPGILLAAGFALGVILPRPNATPLPREVWIDSDARVATVPRTFADETVQEISLEDLRLQMAVPREVTLALGDVIHVQGLAKPLSESSDRLLRKGISGKIRPIRVAVLAPGPWILQVGSGWRNSFSAFCEKWLPAQSASEVEAICFNVESALDQDSRDQLSRSGLVHIVSASGMHVGILALAIMGILSLFPIPRSLRILVMAAVLGIYAVASGLHPPVLRAGLMALVLSAAYLFQREPDMLSALALAAIAQLFWDASAIFDPGFQLSFVVVAAFALFSVHSPSRGKGAPQRILSQAKSVVFASLLATVAAMPLVAYYFGLVSFTSLPANLLVAFVLPVLVVCAMAAHLVSFAIPALGVGLLSGIAGPLAGWIDWVADHLGRNWAAIQVPAFSGYWVVLAYALMILAWRPRLRPA